MLLFSGILLFFFFLMQIFELFHFREYISVIFPKGIVGIKERNLLLIVQALMLLVVVPVYIMTFVFSWKYRADNPQGDYDPDLVDHKLLEVIWWGFPLVMTLIVCVLTWIKTTELDPYRPLEPIHKQKTIQVIALQWKWLFLYPEEKIASLNFLQIPKEIPIRFEITADAPMNSFWIPDLGGQIYAMPKMRTLLHLMANEEGTFRGLSANISGVGFADMHFQTKASTEEDYQKWVQAAQDSPRSLDFETYEKLASPSASVPPETFQLKDGQLFEQVLNKYMK